MPAPGANLVGAGLPAKRGHSLASQLLRAMQLLATINADIAISFAKQCKARLGVQRNFNFPIRSLSRLPR